MYEAILGAAPWKWVGVCTIVILLSGLIRMWDWDLKGKLSRLIEKIRGAKNAGPSNEP